MKSIAWTSLTDETEYTGKTIDPMVGDTTINGEEITQIDYDMVGIPSAIHTSGGVYNRYTSLDNEALIYTKTTTFQDAIIRGNEGEPLPSTGKLTLLLSDGYGLYDNVKSYGDILNTEYVCIDLDSFVQYMGQTYHYVTTTSGDHLNHDNVNGEDNSKRYVALQEGSEMAGYDFAIFYCDVNNGTVSINEGEPIGTVIVRTDIQ